MNKGLWKECIEFHGHACPGLATGFRAAQVAMDELGIPLSRAKDEELVCVTENEACGVDCIQYLTACTAGKGNLIFRPSGKMAYSFFHRDSGRSVRVVAKRFDRTEDREKIIERILNAPAEEIFMIKKPKYDVPERARMFESVVCEECNEACREDKIRLQNGKMLCIDCFDPYDRG